MLLTFATLFGVCRVRIPSERATIARQGVHRSAYRMEPGRVRVAWGLLSQFPGIAPGKAPHAPATDTVQALRPTAAGAHDKNTPTTDIRRDPAEPAATLGRAEAHPRAPDRTTGAPASWRE